MDYSSESVSFLDTRVSIKDGHLSTSLYRKPMDNLMMPHFSNFHPKHLKMLKDDLIRMGYDIQLIDCQFRHATAKTCNNLLTRQTQDTTDKVSFVVRYFPGVEKLCHVLHSLQHIIDGIEHFANTYNPIMQPLQD
eukprot:g43926.t1